MAISEYRWIIPLWTTSEWDGGYHIFGDEYKYRSSQQKRLSKKIKKLSKSGKISGIKTLKNRLKRIKKRDNKALNDYKKELAKKKTEKALKEQSEKTDKKIKKQGTKFLTDNELRKQIQRLQLENQYTALRRVYDRNKMEYGKKTSTKVLDKIGKTILEPSLINSSKNVVGDLITKLGKSTNTAINQGYQELLKDVFNTDYNNYNNNNKNNKLKNNRNNNYKKKKRY